MTAAGTGLALAAAADTATATAANRKPGRRVPFTEVPGPLRADPAGLLALPAGFRYTVVSRAGSTRLVTGEKSPDRPDGAGAFAVRGRVRLVQNHEITPGRGENPVPVVTGTRYDAGLVGGGCTVIETTQSGRRLSEWVGLSGTVRNCAGGVTPWNTWLSCEESEVKAGTAFGVGGTARQDHGFVFEVAPAAPGAQRPVPIKAWGRYPQARHHRKGARVTIQLNHTIVASRDKQECATFLAEILGLDDPTPFGPFLVVQLDNGVSLDFADDDGPVKPQHYAFLVDEADFDEIFGRVRARGLSYWADPARRRPGEVNTNDGGRGVYWEEPSGHFLEIITRPYGSGS